MRLLLCGFALIATVALAALVPPLARADDATAVVNCLNIERQVVSKTIRGRCQGRVIDDSEAARIEDERRAYMQRAFTAPRLDRKSASPEGGPSLPGGPPAAPRGRGKRPAPPPAEQDLKGIGSGFFVSTAGHLLTNDHVVRYCSRLTVSPASGETTAAATVVARDARHDLALLKVDARPRSIAQFSSAREPRDALHVGIVGYPDRGLPVIKPQLEPGRIDGTIPVGRRFTAVQIKADVRPGTSGGPVLDPYGNVVGVVFANVHTPNVYRRSGDVVRGVGYAVPNELAKKFLASQQVRYRQGGAGATDPDLLATARAFVARINCY